jgi:hypothetical protein
MKTTKKYLLLIGLPALLALAATPALAAEAGEVAATSVGGTALLLVMGVTLVLAGVVGYVLRLVAGLGGPRRQTPGGAAPGKFAPYLAELDGPQLYTLQNLPHAQSSLPTLLTHDHAKEQLV